MFPMCWKCWNCLKADIENSTAQTMVGCKENTKIKDFNDAQHMCPLNNCTCENCGIVFRVIYPETQGDIFYCPHCGGDEIKKP